MMAEGSPPWRVLGKRRVYASEWINLDFWSVRLPDGTVIKDYTVLDYPRPAVAVLPIGGDGRVLMIDHYRFITDTRSWSFRPAGSTPANRWMPRRAASCWRRPVTLPLPGRPSVSTIPRTDRAIRCFT